MGNCARKPSTSDGANASSDQLPFEQKTPYDKRETGFNQQLVPLESSNNNLKAFSFSDLKNATRNFRSDCLIGQGGFGCVFKGWIDAVTLAPCIPGTGIMVAIKKLNAGSFQGHKEWLTEINYLGQLHHENLVKLIGYCSEYENRLLVYEFMTRGSLENHLFRKSVEPIPWTTRKRIALDVGRGLSFLHSLDANVIFRDMKAANILLDLNFNVKLSDLGLARDGPIGDDTHVSTRIVGTQVYAAPEYVATGRLTPKSDVYSYGVVLLELLSGRRASGNENAGGVEETLPDWAMRFLGDERRFYRIMDTGLGGQYSKKDVKVMVGLVLQCLHVDPKKRPSMLDAVNTLENIVTK